MWLSKKFNKEAIEFLIGLTFIVLLSANRSVLSQTFRIKGNVHTADALVQNALVTFTDDTDPTKVFTAITDHLGNYELSIFTEVTPQPNVVPQTIELAQNYPNPFSSSTAISYNLNKQADVSIKIFDILGREVKAFKVGIQEVGLHEILWDGKDNLGNRLPIGIYFYQFQTGEKTITRKMLFGINDTPNIGISLPIEKTFPSNRRELKEENQLPLTMAKFTVNVRNCGYTRPKILSTDFPNIIIHQDTTLNFQVQEEIMEYSLCYSKIDSTLQDGKWRLNWEIFLNNIMGTKSKNITNWAYTDEAHNWSPDGKYIAFSREDPQDTDLYLYDTANDTLIGFLTADTSHDSMITWTHDSKRIIYLHWSRLTGARGFYIIDLDGTNNRELKYPVAYLYPDDYNILYTVKLSTKGDLVYHSNLDGTINEFIVDLTEFVHTNNGGVTICDFNPNANKLLLLFDDPSTALPNFIAEYNITDKRLDTIITSDSGWKYYRPKYSNDFRKIAFVEAHIADTINYIQRISIFDHSTKNVLVEFPHKDEHNKSQFIDSSPFAFSPDDKFLAFSKNVVQPGVMVWWISYLYIIDLETNQMTLIDTGSDAEWNPRKPH